MNKGNTNVIITKVAYREGKNALFPSNNLPCRFYLIFARLYKCNLKMFVLKYLYGEIKVTPPEKQLINLKWKIKL